MTHDGLDEIFGCLESNHDLELVLCYHPHQRAYGITAIKSGETIKSETFMLSHKDTLMSPSKAIARALSVIASKLELK